MKKNFKIFGICILIALALQSIVLLFLNYKTFSGFKPNDVTTKLNKKVDNSEYGKNADKTITVDADAKNITTSYDNSYIAYINKDNKLTYTDMRDNRKKVIEDIQPTMYRWSANNIILVAKNQQERNSYDFYEYNTEKNELNKLQTLRLSDSKGSIEDVKCSPFKTLIFVQVKSFNRDEIYKLNVKMNLIK